MREVNADAFVQYVDSGGRSVLVDVRLFLIVVAVTVAVMVVVMMVVMVGFVYVSESVNPQIFAINKFGSSDGLLVTLPIPHLWGC